VFSLTKRRVKVQLESKKARIDWFLNLINLDYSEPTDGDFLKLINDTIYILHGYASDVFEGKRDKDSFLMWMEKKPKGKQMPEIVKEWIENDKIITCQEHIKEFFVSMMEGINKAFAEEQKGYRPLTQTPNKFVLTPPEPTKSNITISLETPFLRLERTLEKDTSGKQIYLSRLVPDELANAAIQIKFIASTDEDTLLLYFIQALEGIPLKAFKQCPECNKWFLHLKDTVKTYCTNNCASSYIMRKNRSELKKNDPDKYKEEGAKSNERAKKHYDKKVRVTDPNVKIGRDKRKK
jgi:hypothetical protein